MRRSIILLSLTTLLAAGPQLEIDRAASAMAGMEGQFTQRFTPRGFKSAQVENGSVLFGPLPMMRWSYSKPEEKLFVFDGTTSAFYVPAENQVTVSRVSESKKRDLPFLLLGDAAAREKLFRVTEKRRGNATTTVLDARDPAAQIRSVALTISTSTHLIQRIEYSDREGNRTVFDFGSYRRRAASADVFRFAPPPGVQVVHTD